MSIRRLTAAAAAVGLLAFASPAFAAGPPYTVKIGTTTSGTHPVGLSRATGSSFTFTAGHPLGCQNVISNGTATAGTNVNPIFIFTTFDFTGCSLNDPAETPVTTTLLATPRFSGTSNNATAGSEIIAGRVVNFAVRVHAGSCQFDVTGFANASFNESNQRLFINEVPTSASAGNLTVSNVVTCGGQVQNGTKATLQVFLVTTSSAGLVNLS